MELLAAVRTAFRSLLRWSFGSVEKVQVTRSGVVTTWNLAWRTHNLLHISRFSLLEGDVIDTVHVNDPSIEIVE